MDEGDRLLSVVPKLLELLRDGSPPKQALYWLLVVLSQHSSCESSGMRWRANGDYPYYVTRGFDQRHVVREGSLHDRDAAGEILRHRDGTPRLACLCGAVMTQHTFPDLPCLTEGGSFWTNDLSKLLEERVLADAGVVLRGECHREHYESVALIPVRSEGKTYGLIQLNSHVNGRFATGQIESYEQLAGQVATAAGDRVVDAAAE
jgi:GAF domain-containing protein